jgi:hypothetical protein
MTIPHKRVAILSPVAWRTPPRRYGAWEAVVGNITEERVSRGWDVTLFATRESVTRAYLHAVVGRGFEEGPAIDPEVAEYLQIRNRAGYDTSRSSSGGRPIDLCCSSHEVFGLSCSSCIESACVLICTYTNPQSLGSNP